MDGTPQAIPAQEEPQHLFRHWLQALRARFFITSLFPVAAGLLLAAGDGHFDARIAAITLVGVLAIHVGTNLANDYYDFIQYEGDLAYQGGSGVLQEGKLSPTAVRNAAWGAFLLAALIGIYLAGVAGPLIFLFTVLGLCGGFFYSAPPIRFGYRGLAEIVCGISMGPVIVWGTYYVQTATISTGAAAVSFPLASFVAFILFSESIHDIDEDRQTGKWTLAARIGEAAALRLFGVWLTVSGLVIALLTGFGLLPPSMWILIVPIALGVYRLFPFLAGRYEHEHLYRLGRIALRLYLLTGVLLVLGLALALP